MKNPCLAHLKTFFIKIIFSIHVIHSSDDYTLCAILSHKKLMIDFYSSVDHSTLLFAIILNSHKTKIWGDQNNYFAN